MASRRLTTFFLVLRAALAAGLLVWVLNRLRWEEMAALSWGGLQWGWLAVALGLGGLSVLGWAGRWWWFLRVYGVKARFGELLRLTLFADFFNLYFLGPLGADGVRLLLLSRSFPERKGAILGSLILDHIGGLIGGAVLYGLFSRQSGLAAAVQASADVVLCVTVGVCFLGLGVIMEPWLQRFLGKVPGLRKVTSWLAPAFAGTFRHPWLFAGFAVSAAGTASAYAAYWAAAQALGAAVSPEKMLGLMPVVDAIASLPISLSGIGIREGLLVEWLGSQPGLGAGQALGASLLGFAALGLWGLMGGLWLAFWRKKHGQPTDGNPV